jgi:hypothetical protein
MLERANESCGDSRPAVSAGRSPAAGAKKLPGRAQQPTQPFYIFRTDIPDDKISQSIL